MNTTTGQLSRALEPYQITTMDAVNWVLVLIVCLFLFQLLSEMLFRQRGKFCKRCQAKDLPRNWQVCQICGEGLEEYVELVTPFERRISFGIPATLLLAAMAAYHYFGRASHGGPLVVFCFVAASAMFAQLWLPRRDERLRTLFNVPFWGCVALVLGFIVLDLALRLGAGEVLAQRTLAVTDMEVEPDGTVCLALRDGSLCHGVGAGAYPYLRGVAVKRLLRSGSGDVLVYSDSQKLAEPDGLLAARGLQWHPPKALVETGVKLMVAGVQLAPEHRSLLDRCTFQPNVNFCVDEGRIWVVDGQRLFRIQPDGTSETFSLGRRELGRLVKVAPGKGWVWLLSSKGITGIKSASDRKTWYELMEFVQREGQAKSEIVAGAVKDDVIWFATNSGDVMKFDLNKERLSFEGPAQCPRYLDFYNYYTLPFLLLALGWTLSANFRPEEK